MALPSELHIILERIETSTHTPADLATLRQHLTTPQILQNYATQCLRHILQPIPISPHNATAKTRSR